MTLLRSNAFHSFLLGFALTGGILLSQYGLVDLSPMPEAIAGSIAR